MVITDPVHVGMTCVRSVDGLGFFSENVVAFEMDSLQLDPVTSQGNTQFGYLASQQGYYTLYRILSAQSQSVESVVFKPANFFHVWLRLADVNEIEILSQRIEDGAIRLAPIQNPRQKALAEEIFRIFRQTQDVENTELSNTEGASVSGVRRSTSGQFCNSDFLLLRV